MVEANVEQPQDSQRTPGNNRLADALLESIEEKYKEQVESVQEILNAFDNFKETVWKKLLNLIKETDELKTMFKEFEAQQGSKIPGFKVFEKGSKSYSDLLTIDIEKINQSLENEIMRTKNGLKTLEKIKDEKFRSMMVYLL